jgi:predicted transcriptional regulator
VANVNVRVDDELAARFDAWAATRGGRSPALRGLMAQAVASGGVEVAGRGLGRRPVKLTVRLTAADAAGLAAAAAGMGLTRNAWAAALIRARLQLRPTFRPQDDDLLGAVQTELRRIGVNVNQIARALNTAVLEGRVLALELDDLEALRLELRGHMRHLREAFEGNLAYWAVEP